jgi:hypothetical protein
MTTYTARIRSYSSYPYILDYRLFQRLVYVEPVIQLHIILVFYSILFYTSILSLHGS